VAERENEWNFLISVYFTSGALLTIGYGDFTPTTNSAKPIFVLWTLFAIPIITITIGNSADTIIKEFQGFVLLIGSLTVFPGQDGLKKVVKSWYLKLTRDRIPVGACVSSKEHPFVSKLE
jgi:potassium channel subfamily K